MNLLKAYYLTLFHGLKFTLLSPLLTPSRVLYVFISDCRKLIIYYIGLAFSVTKIIGNLVKVDQLIC
jgi:hypothetical protein